MRLKSWTIALIIVGGATLVSLPARAQAASPNIYRDTGSGSFVDYATCDDDLQVTFDYDEVVHEFADASGAVNRVSYTGPVHITYTNLSNGATYSPNSSGPGTFDTTTGAQVLRGSNGAVWDANGVLVSHQGRIVYDANGVIVSMVGHSTDVCAAVGSSPA